MHLNTGMMSTDRKVKNISLPHWGEIVGKLFGCDFSDDFVRIDIETKDGISRVGFSCDSEEKKLLETVLIGLYPGDVVGLLYSDVKGKRILIRRLYHGERWRVGVVDITECASRTCQ